jgi:drug/metabolite transporter (DMT)-like permease
MDGVAAWPGRESARVKVAITVTAALCAAFCFALGSLIQQDAARQAHSRTLRFGLLVALVHERRWLAGMTITVLSFGIQAVALAFGPLALVQPLVATEVLFTLPMIARSPALLGLQLAGGAIAAAGIVLLSRSPVALAEERRESRRRGAQTSPIGSGAIE